jgi:uncharacterized membrane protein
MAIDEPKGWMSLILGVVLLALGIIPLLNQFGVIQFGLPGILTTLIPSILAYIFAIAGLVLAVDAFMEDDTLRIVSLIVGVLILAAGVISILNAFQVIGFTVPLLDNPVVYNIIFVVEGIFLIIAAFAMV